MEETVPKVQWYRLQDRIGELIRERDEARRVARELVVESTWRDEYRRKYPWLLEKEN